MSDLIRREDALEAIVDERTHTILQAWINVKNTVPSIDAIEVVRCKECKRWNTNGCHLDVGECEWAFYMTKPDDFCSYGERKSDEH